MKWCAERVDEPSLIPVLRILNCFGEDVEELYLAESMVFLHPETNVVCVVDLGLDHGDGTRGVHRIQ